MNCGKHMYCINVRGKREWIKFQVLVIPDVRGLEDIMDTGCSTHASPSWCIVSLSIAPCTSYYLTHTTNAWIWHAISTINISHYNNTRQYKLIVFLNMYTFTELVSPCTFCWMHSDLQNQKPFQIHHIYKQSRVNRSFVIFQILLAIVMPVPFLFLLIRFRAEDWHNVVDMDEEEDASDQFVVSQYKKWYLWGMYIIWLSMWRRHYPNPKLLSVAFKIFYIY